MGKYKPKVTGTSWFYAVLKLLVQPSIWYFWRRKQYYGLKKLDRRKPLFFLPNHQNAFLDAICFTPLLPPRQFTFLMRAASFKGGMVSTLLHKLGMLPIYRQMDGTDQLDKNNEVFENCAYLLEHKRPLVCYAEGTHSLIRKIRPFKKGPLRFAFGAEDRNGFKLHVQMVAVGIYYSERENFGSDMLMHFSKPFMLADYEEVYRQNPARALNQLKQDMEQALIDVSIHITNDAYYPEIELCREMTVNSLRVQHHFNTTLIQEFGHAKKTIAHAEQNVFNTEPRAQEVKAQLNQYNTLIGKSKLRDYLFDPGYKPSSPVLYWLLFIALFPVFVVGFVLNIIPFKLPGFVARKVVRDPAFNSSILWAVGMFGFFFYYIILIVLTGLISGNWWYALVVYATGFVSAVTALWYVRKWKKFGAIQRLKKFRQTPEGKTAYDLRKRIMQVIAP